MTMSHGGPEYGDIPRSWQHRMQVTRMLQSHPTIASSLTSPDVNDCKSTFHHLLKAPAAKAPNTLQRQESKFPVP